MLALRLRLRFFVGVRVFVRSRTRKSSVEVPEDGEFPCAAPEVLALRLRLKKNRCYWKKVIGSVDFVGRRYCHFAGPALNRCRLQISETIE